jgi:hypothetical protein
MDISAGENRVLRGERQVGGENEAEPEPRGPTLHRGDDRLWQVAQPDQQRVQRVDDLLD